MKRYIETMGTALCWFILILLNCAVMFKAAPNDDYILPGQTYPDDLNACFWFNGQDGKSIFRCCNGTQKSDWGNITESCTECQEGSYGNNCEHNCTCLHGGICNKANGSCSCINNYFGNNCQFACNCENDGTCLSDGSCICSNRFYGELCQSGCLCPKDRKCHGKICICQDGYYDSCSLGKCSGNSANDAMNLNCNCNSDDIYSIPSCLPCNCSDNGECDPLTGYCTCNAGYHGDHCDKQCSCYNGAVCSEAESDCKCAYGWKGPNCTECDLERDAQSEQLFCGDKCFHCYNGDTCKVANGDCNCTPGWQGNRCDQKCDEGFFGYNCAQECQCKHDLCDHVDGSCHCDEGWIGHHCNFRCAENCVKCKDDVCMSCKPGWAGVHCNQTCKDGYYGDSCKHKCPKCHCSNSCNYTDGSCTDIVSCHEHNCTCEHGVRCFENTSYCECQDGWSGSTCDVETYKVAEEGTSEDGHSKIPILIAMVIFIGSVALVAVIIFIIKLYVLQKKGAHKGIYDERCTVGDDAAVSPCQAPVTLAMSSNGNSTCSVQSEDTDRTDGSESQTTAEEGNGDNLFNGDQSKRLIFHVRSKNLNSAAGEKSAFEGPYSIVPIQELLHSDSDSDTENTACYILDKLRYNKEERRCKFDHLHYEEINLNSDTDDHEYEMIRHSYKFDNRKAS